MASDFQADIDTVNRIDAVATILEVVCRVTGMGFAAVARVTEDRWIACSVLDRIAFGLEPGGELAIGTTICNEVRQLREPIVIDHVAEDETYCRHPTPALYGFQSYISMPIVRRDGTIFGTLCAIDPRPAMLKTPETIGMFKLFAELIASHLDAQDQLAESEASLVGERKSAELREQFVAVLGHDLRNPLHAILAAAEMLGTTPIDNRGKRFIRLIRTSAERAGGLIENLMDLAQARLGGGLPIERKPQDLGPVLIQILSELRISWPGRSIDASFDLAVPVNCDAARIGQLFSNLLANALAYGRADAPVRVCATTAGGAFDLSVFNAGDPIPAEAMRYLFRPFFRVGQSGQGGLGLGLYIASEIAKGHDGSLSVASSPDRTWFTFRMPLAP